MFRAASSLVVHKCDVSSSEVRHPDFVSTLKDGICYPARDQERLAGPSLQMELKQVLSCLKHVRSGLDVFHHGSAPAPGFNLAVQASAWLPHLSCVVLRCPSQRRCKDRGQLSGTWSCLSSVVAGGECACVKSIELRTSRSVVGGCPGWQGEECFSHQDPLCEPRLVP